MGWQKLLKLLLVDYFFNQTRQILPREYFERLWQFNCFRFATDLRWQISCGHNRHTYVDEMGEFSWTLLVMSSPSKSVHENSPKICPWKFTQEEFSWTKSVHENSPSEMSTRIRPFWKKNIHKNSLSTTGRP